MESNHATDPRSLSGISEGYEQLHELDGKLLDENLEFTDCLAMDDPLFPGGEWDQTSPYETNLYSTPLSWDPPQANTQAIKQEMHPGAENPMSTLTAAQQEKLCNIAMPPHYRSQYSPKSTLSAKSNSASSPESNNNNLKRKSSADLEEEEEGESSGGHAPKKTSHNMIEKRYRTNLNDKIAALRDSVPSLRIMTKSARGEDTVEDREELQGLTPAHKLNKATVLSKATEYIAHLEKRNKRLKGENDQQKARLDAFVKLFNSGSMGMTSASQFTQPFQPPPDYQTPSQSPGIEGMIRVPDDMRRLHSQASQQIYQIPQEQVQQPQQRRGPHGWQNGGGGYLNKFMIGSLAGLMILEGFNEVEQDAENPNARGLLALPFHALKGVSRTVHSSLEFSVAGYHIPAAYTLHYLKLFFVLGAFIYTFLPSWLASKHPPPDARKQSASITAAPSLASPIQVRRHAWLTAIQTIWVPRHNFFLEAAALCLKIVKLSIRNTIGVQGYAFLSGTTEKQEVARINAWTFALDAQLAGGDVEISKSRLTLTLLASGTLPDTPARLMLKALHIRVLLWEFGNAGFNGIYIGREVAAKLARSRWNEAKNLQRLIRHTKTQGEDELPEYLATLLEEECDDVLVDIICQRAYNLAWNLPTTYNMIEAADGMDMVVDDFAIRSPLDAVAAWWSCLVLQRALTRSLECKNPDVATQARIADELTLAIKAAPIGSSAQTRTLVARAVLVKEKRGANIAAAWKVLGPIEPQDTGGASVPTFINAITSYPLLPDLKVALRCATAIAHLERFPAPANPEMAHHILNTLAPVKLTLLGFTAQFQLAEKINDNELVAESCDNALEKLAGNLRIWIGGREGEKSGLEKEVKLDLVDRCLGITRRILGIGARDAGYDSMEEDEDGPKC